MPRPNQQRFNNMIDGTYINVPDLHVLQPSKKIGLREYNNGVLVHNWYEERNPVMKSLDLLNIQLSVIIIDGSRLKLKSIRTNRPISSTLSPIQMPSLMWLFVASSLLPLTAWELKI